MGITLQSGPHRKELVEGSLFVLTSPCLHDSMGHVTNPVAISGRLYHWSNPQLRDAGQGMMGMPETAALKPCTDIKYIELNVGRKAVTSSVLRKDFPKFPLEFNVNVDRCFLHLQKQAAGQGDVVALHSQVQRRVPCLPLLGVDVCPCGHQQQQTLHAVAHHGYMNGVQTCSPSTGTVTVWEGCSQDGPQWSWRRWQNWTTERERQRVWVCLVLTAFLHQTVFTGAVSQFCMWNRCLLLCSQETWEQINTLRINDAFYTSSSVFAQTSVFSSYWLTTPGHL